MYIVWVIIALSLVTSIKLVIGCVCTLLNHNFMVYNQFNYSLVAALQQCSHVLHLKADHQLIDLVLYNCLYLYP